MNSSEFIKIGTTEASLVFSWLKRKTVESGGLHIIILRGVCTWMCRSVLSVCHERNAYQNIHLKKLVTLLNPIFW